MSRYGPLPGVKLKEYAGVGIYVDNDGVFRAEVGTRTLERKNVKDLEKEIQKSFTAIDALKVTYYGPHGINRVKVIEYVKGSRQFREDNRNLNSEGIYFRYNQAAFALFADIERDRMAEDKRHQEAEQALRVRFEDAKKSLTYLLPEDLNIKALAPEQEEPKNDSQQ